MNNKKGFTLIEILIVISVIGILASIVLVNLGGFRSRGRDARRIADLRTMQNALELYYANEGNYPAGDSAALYAAVEALPGIGKLPRDPATGNPMYSYGTDANGLSYVLGATLENKNTVLGNDEDGTTYNVVCGTQGDTEREYCVKF